MALTCSVVLCWMVLCWMLRTKIYRQLFDVFACVFACPPLQVRDWYVESFRELRGFPKVKDASDELQFTRLLQHIYRRHTNVVPVMAMGVAGARAVPAATAGATSCWVCACCHCQWRRLLGAPDWLRCGLPCGRSVAGAGQVRPMHLMCCVGRCAALL